MPSMVSAPLSRGPVTVELWSDASGNVGWGGHSDRGEFVQGEWGRHEIGLHINAKELLGAHKTIDALLRPGDNASISLDSRSAAAYVNKMGGTVSSNLSGIALAIWDKVVSRGSWVTAHWIPREENGLSDMLSKTRMEVWEFGLHPQVATFLWSMFFTPTMDLFASREFHLLPYYSSWYPDREAAARDAFSFTWPERAFAFPPVPLLDMVLRKVEEDRVTVLLVVPNWTNALWRQTLEKMLVQPPLSLGSYRNIVVSSPGQKLPYLGELQACLVRGGSFRC